MDSRAQLVGSFAALWLGYAFALLLVLAAIGRFLSPRARTATYRAGLALTLCAIGWLAFEYVREERRVGAMRAVPTWASLEGPDFRLEPGATGEWTPRWEPVEHAVALPRLFCRARYETIDEEPTRVLVRVEPPDAARGSAPELAGPDGTWVAPQPYDGRRWIEVDPLRSPRLSWRVDSVTPRLVGSLARLGVDGHADTHHAHDAHHLELAMVVVSILLGVPLAATGIVFAWLLWRERRGGPVSATESAS